MTKEALLKNLEEMVSKGLEDTKKNIIESYKIIKKQLEYDKSDKTIDRACYEAATIIENPKLAEYFNLAHSTLNSRLVVDESEEIATNIRATAHYLNHNKSILLRARVLGYEHKIN